MTYYSEITLVITSCKRFELLERTIASMRPWINKFAVRYIVEDSQESPAIFRHFDRLIVPTRKFLQNTSFTAKMIGYLIENQTSITQCIC